MKENAEVTEFINKAPSGQREIMEAVRELIHKNINNVTEEFKWGRPVFKAKNNFAYLKNTKAYVNLGFFNYEKLRDSENRLEGTGKDMRHIKLKSIKDIDSALLSEWFKAAAE